MNPNQTPITGETPVADVRKKIIDTYQRRIQQSVFKISEKVRTQERVILDAFIRHVAPSLSKNSDNHFPTSVHRMMKDHDRTPATLFPHVLYFHVGTAIMTFYDFVNGFDVSEALENRIERLEKMGATGFAKYVVHGDDRLGYHLIHSDELDMPFKPNTPFRK